MLKIMVASLGLLVFMMEVPQAQVAVSSDDSHLLTYRQIKKVTKVVKDESIYQGDLYLYDDWRYAEFELPSSDKIIVDSVKLNLFRGRVEIHQKGEHLEVDNKEFDSFAFLGEESEFPAYYKYRHYYYDKGKRLPGTIKILDVGDYSVLVAFISEVRKVSQENPLMLDKLKKDKIRISRHRYIEKDGELTRIKSKKDLQKYFGSSKKVKNYISKHKLSHKKEEDIARVVQFAMSEG